MEQLLNCSTLFMAILLHFDFWYMAIAMPEVVVRKKDFRVYLQKEFIKRCQKNPKYSLRAFAKHLNISHATLSHIVRGKRPLTAHTILHLAQGLELRPRELAQFHIPGERASHKTIEKLKFSPIDIDTFEAISDWYHDAILELTKVKQFKGEPRWIAKVLGISTREARTAVKRLQRLNLLKISNDGTWVDESTFSTTIKSAFTTTALRKYQRQVLEKASRALEEIPFEKRDQSSVTLPIHVQDLPKARRMIKDFRRKLCNNLKRKDMPPEQVYQLSLSFYPLTNVEAPV